MVPKKIHLCAALLFSLLPAGVGHSQTLDTVIFGNATSESAHALATGWDSPAPNSVVDANNGIYPSNPSLTPPSDVVVGGVGQTARRLLPRTPNPDIYGGQMTFTMVVDPARQNYVTIKLWGSDASSGIWFVLNVDGNELGLRHGGDSAAPDMLFGNKQIVTFAPNQWVYRTLALPLHLTQGKTSVTMKIRSMGWISDYDSGPLFGDYNKLMNTPSLGLYRIYTHLGSKLDTAGEAQGAGFTPSTPRSLESETTVISTIKTAVNNQIAKLLAASQSSLKPWDLAWLAQCYDAKENLGESWISYGGTNTASTLVQKVIDGIDYQVGRQAADGNYFNSFGNASWGGGFGDLGTSIRILWPQINTGATMATSVPYGGSYGTITRTSGWSKALRTSVDFGRYNRRGGLYANQDVIGVEHTYNANRGLLLVDPSNAIQESEAQRYLKEACGLLPWAGSDQNGGGAVPVKGTYPLGDSFYEVTTDGTTKDGGGFVGSDYGEMGSAVVRWGILSGNTDIRDRGLQMMRVRAFFRFPSFDGQGYRVMQAANPIGVRNRELPGHYGYLERGAGGVDVAALGTSVIGNDLMGYFQNGISDGQQLQMMSGSTDPYMVRNWNLAKAAATTNVPVPMSPGAPDFAWVDEENMVVAAKSGENRIFANLYWAAPDHINGWAKIFHLPANTAPEFSEVQVNDVRYRPTGTFKTLGPRVDSSTRQPFDNPVSAYNGVVVPLASRSDLSSIPANNPDAGKGTGYTLRYGHWLIGINADASASYDMVLPSNFATVLPIKDLVSGNTISTATVTLAPKKSAVFYLPDTVDSVARPMRPLWLTAKSTATAIVLDWNDTVGAATYNVKRSTTPGSGYTPVGTAGASSFIDTTATPNTTYYYVVSGVNPAGNEGGDSPEASASLKAAGLLNRVGDGIASANLSNSSYPPANAFDASTSTKWNSGSTGTAAWLQYDFGPNITWAVTRYDITSADTTNRDPASWIFQGSNDGANWTTLDTRTNETFASRALANSYTFTNTTGYRYYRLNVSAASGGLGYEIQLAELGLYATNAGTVPVPPAPAGLTATSGNKNVFLNWTMVGAANSYTVKRATSVNGIYATIGSTENRYFLDTSAPSSGTYYYVVTAVNTGGESSASSAVNAVFAPTSPTAPTGLTAAGGPNAGNVTLTWNASPGVPTYTVKRSTTPGSGYATVASGITDTSYIDTGRQNGVAYYYVVSATIAGIESADSTQAAVTPQTYVWSGTSASWGTASNWGGTAPANGSLLIFSGTPSTTSTSNNLSGLSINGLVFNSGASAFTLAGNALTLGGDIVDYASNTQMISLGLTLSANRTIDVESGQLTISGAITDGSNTYSLTKTGSGILALTASNTFDGGLNINAGTLQVGTSTNSSASGSTTTLGPSGSSVTLGAATLRFQMGSGSANTIPNNFVFNSGAVVTTNDGKITMGASTNTITVNGATLLQPMWNNKWLALGGGVSGSGDISIKNGSSQTSAVDFTNGANTYTGTITIEDTNSTMAALAVGSNTALSHAKVNAECILPGSYAVWFDTTAPVLGSLTGVAGSAIMLNTDGGLYGSGPSTSNSAVVLSVGNDNSDCTYEGNLTGTGSLTKVGTGTFTLAGSNTYSGVTTVSNGTLLLLTPLSGTGNIVVNNGGTLAGATSLAGTLVANSGGVVAPGGSNSGTLTTSGLTLNSGSTLDFGLGAISGSDCIALNNGIYTGPSSGLVTLRFAPQSGFGPGTYTLITGAAGIDPNSFTIGTTPPSGYTYTLAASGGTLSLIVTGPPSAITGLHAYGKNTAVSLAWDATPGATSYTVYMSTAASSGFSSVNTTTSTSYAVSGLANNTAYYFYITATNGYGTSNASSVVTATPQPNTWITSPSSLNWSLASNWGGASPMSNAQLTFGSSSATNLTNDLTGLTVGGMVFNSGASAFTISGNSILLTGDITNNSTSAQTINLQITLVGTRTITTNTGAVILNGAVDDGGFEYGLVKAGSGALTLAGANAFTGGVAINAGTLVLSGSSPLGNGDPITLGSGTTLQLSATTISNDIVIPAGISANLTKILGTNSLNGRLTGAGSISESGGVSSGIVSIQWNGDNSGFTGSLTSANSGNSHRWRFNTPAAGSAAAAWTLNCTTTDAYGFAFGSDGTISFGSLAGSGALRNDGNGTATIRIGDLGTNTTFSGSTIYGINLLKVGTGTLTLSGSSLGHSGTTTVSAGTLNLTGAITTSPVAVQSGATLSGTGTLGGSVTVNSGGIVSPGNGGAGSTGTLTLNGTFAPAAGSHLSFEVGSTSDQLALGSTSNFSAPSGGSAFIDLSAASGFTPGTYTLISNAGSGTLSLSNFSLGSLPDGYAGTLSMNGTSLQVTIRVAGASWTGTSSGVWSLAANWGGTAPIDGDSLVFGTSSNVTLNNDLTNLLTGSIVFASGASAYTISGNSLRLGGNITNNSTSSEILGTPITLMKNITVNTNTGGITLNGVISESGGSYGLTKIGSGILKLTGSNTFSGGFSSTAGDTYITGLGSGTAGTPTAGALGTGTITLAGGRIVYNTANTSLYNNIVAQASTSTTILEAANYTLYLYGNISGSGNITLDANTNYNGVHLAGNNSGFTGTMTLTSTGNSARHKFDSPNAGSASAKWVLNGPTDSGSMNFGTGTISFGEVSGSATQIRNDQSGTATISIGALNTDSTFSGVFSSVGILALQKIGSGTLTLSGVNTYTGSTTIDKGTLKFLNTKSGTGAVTVNNGGTLAGTATVAGPITVNNGGTIAPGNAGAGTLTVSGAVTFSSGSILNLDLGATTASDKLALTGTSYTGPATGSVTINLNALTGFGAGTYTLITGATGISASSFALGQTPTGYTYALSASSGTLTLTVTAWTAMETWRYTNFGSASNTGISADTADPDGDGLTNAQEYAAGTDPKDSSSALRISAVTPSGNDILVSFPSVSGKTYRVDYTDTLQSGSWTTVQDNITGTGGVIRITDTNGAAHADRFYRVVIP